MRRALRWCEQCHQFDECYDEFGGPYLLTPNCYSYQYKTEILITSSCTGGTERETQIVIDALQAKGWNIIWGIGTSHYCTDDERVAFERDFRKAIAAHVEKAA